MNVVEHRAACVGNVGRMHLAAREVPDEPAVDGAEEQAALIGKLACASHVVEQPLDLARREVRVRMQARGALDVLAGARLGAKLLDDRRRATALPHDRVGDGTAGLAVPDDGRLALVGDADAVDVLGIECMRGEQIGERAELREDDFLRVVLDPSGLRIELPELALHGIDETPFAVDENGA